MLISKWDKEVKKKKKTKYLEIYSDVIKAYDSVVHSRLLEEMNKMKVDSQIINVVRRIVGTTSLALHSGGKEIGRVEVHTGVIQGDSFSPLLFVLYIKRGLKGAESRWSSEEEETLRSLISLTWTI